jgi:hypothetical protein
MKRFLSLLILAVFLVSCGPAAPAQPASPAEAGQGSEAKPGGITAAQPTEAVIEPHIKPGSGKTIVVVSDQDSGEGTLRQAMNQAREGDVITFDPVVFPPDAPKAIQPLSELPAIQCGALTIDASEAGVVLDGSQAGGEWTSGFLIDSSYNVVRGFQITSFSGPGFQITENARFNTIGGERATGAGPYGQGNLIRDTSDGIALRGSDNTILGNLIGTDAAGKEKWSNRSPGIFLEGEASRNVIGPDNVIAYNGIQGMSGGVEFRSTAATGNRVTQNNIHHNTGPAIYYNFNQGEPTPISQSPVILDFDLAAGKASGVTCAGCTVEFFTTAEDGNEVFEGSVTADEYGSFDFQKGQAFGGAGLKAAAYQDGQNTSPFSASVVGKARSLSFQPDNLNPRLALPAVTLDVNAPSQIGTMEYIGCEDPQYASSYYARAAQLGYSWVRVSADWFDWPEVLQTGEFSDDVITPCQAKVIDILHEKGIQILYTIVYWDAQIKVYDGYTRFTKEDEIQRFLDYVRFIVGQFKGKVTWYGLLNEPNLTDGQRAVRVEDYINLARQVIPVIHEVDPQAKIVIGEVTPLNEVGALAYLKTILASDLMPQVDGIAWHGSSGNSLEYQPDFFKKYPGWVDEIVAAARQNGFTGRFFSTELHWRTPDTPQPIDGNPWFYSNTVAGKYYGRGIVWHRARDFLVTVGHEGYESIPEVYQVIGNLTELLAGAQPVETGAALSAPTSDMQTAAFGLPDGSQLIAFWRNNLAVDDDPGVAQTVTIPRSSTVRATGIDPLYAYQQTLVTAAQGDALVIENYLVKDYPTFIHLQP